MQEDQSLSPALWSSSLKGNKWNHYEPLRWERVSNLQSVEQMYHRNAKSWLHVLEPDLLSHPQIRGASENQPGALSLLLPDAVSVEAATQQAAKMVMMTMVAEGLSLVRMLGEPWASSGQLWKEWIPWGFHSESPPLGLIKSPPSDPQQSLSGLCSSPRKKKKKTTPWRCLVREWKLGSRLKLHSTIFVDYSMVQVFLIPFCIWIDRLHWNYRLRQRGLIYSQSLPHESYLQCGTRGPPAKRHLPFINDWGDLQWWGPPPSLCLCSWLPTGTSDPVFASLPGVFCVAFVLN